MDVLGNLALGFSIAFSFQNLIYALVGTIVGNLIGVLPGVGPITAMALLIPFSFGKDPISSIIMMAGVYYGAMYGGAITSILINVPGESSSVPTAMEGYPMARQGRAGPALGMAALASFIAGTFGQVALMFLSPPLADFAIKFGPAEFFALMVLGMCTVTGLAGDSILKGLITACLGLIFGTVGIDVLTSVNRFTFGRSELFEGINFLVVVIGVFAIAEVWLNIEEPSGQMFLNPKVSQLWPTLKDWADSGWAIARGSVLGFAAGIIPGGGATIGSFLAYGVEKRVSAHPERFGKGAIEGLAASEAANNSAVVGAMIPLLTLGIPGTAGTAVLMGALLLFGLQPGPFLFRDHPDFVWALIASMYIGNVMLLIMNLPLISVFIRLLRVPYKVLVAIILTFSFVGVYSINNNVFDLWMMIAFGVFGYFLRKMNYPPAPLILMMVLGTNMEMAFRRALTISSGNPMIFITRPGSAVILAVAAVWLAFLVFGMKKRPVEEA